VIARDPVIGNKHHGGAETRRTDQGSTTIGGEQGELARINADDRGSQARELPLMNTDNTDRKRIAGKMAAREISNIGKT